MDFRYLISFRMRRLLLGWSGLTLLLFAMLKYWEISPSFAYEIYWLERPTGLSITWMMLAGIGYLAVLFSLFRENFLSVRFILLIGVIIRLMMVTSTPVYEDDFYRYFWDGAVTAEGLNPYAYAPIDVLPSPFQDGENADGEPPQQRALSSLENLPYLDRVAYPTIRTIYPPVTQAFFALSHAIAPANLTVWRLLLVLVDCLSVGLLLKLLRVLKKPRPWVAVYWLNPLILTETVNAGHMDVLLLPFLLAAVLAAIPGRYTSAGLALAGAVGVKLWPLILAPIIFRPLLKKPKKLILQSLPFVLATGVLIAPQLWTRFDNDAGLVAYAQSWHVNAFAFSLIEGGFALIVGTDTTGLLDPLFLARLVVLMIVTGTVLHFLRKPFDNEKKFVAGVLWITAILFLFSPTGYPWYFLWVLPWLAIKPHMGLLILTVTLPLYDLRYPLQALGKEDLFNQVIVAIEFVPSFLLIAYQWWRKTHYER